MLAEEDLKSLSEEDVSKFICIICLVVFHQVIYKDGQLELKMSFNSFILR